MEVDELLDAVEQPCPTSPPPERVIPSTTSGRRRFFPAHFQDFLPSLRTVVPHMPPPVRNPTPPPIVPSPSPSPAPLTPEPIIYATAPDSFGLYRSYTTYPTQDPEAEQALDDVCDAPGLLTEPPCYSKKWWSGFGLLNHATTSKNMYYPFLNITVFRLMDWFYGGSNMKSIAELDALVHDVLLADGFDLEHLRDFSATLEMKHLDLVEDAPGFSAGNGWKESSVKVRLPAERQKHVSEDHAPEFEVSGIWHRSLLEVIQTAFQDASASSFHLTPFRLFWKPNPDSEPERVITELYNSDAFLEEHEKLQRQAKEPGCDLERVVAAMMIWSDSTHLANFGSASLWPMYAFFGNESKYLRAKPSNFSAHHFAYIPSVGHSSFSTT